MNDTKKQELFKDFLSKNKILLVDKSSASRRRLVKTLVDMGSNRQSIFSVSHYSEALEIIETEAPKLVLSDFKLNGGSGFDLFKSYRQKVKKLDDSVLVLVTSNISQSAVAKAAEEDVDSFIIKPYTVQSLEKSLINTVILKLYPTEYMQLIDKGKELLFNSEYEESIAVFEEAKTKSKRPSLALFYIGQARYFMKMVSDAQKNYQEGLSINNIHFKCQIGLYEIFMKEKKYNEAYDVVRNIAKYFPANPDRLKEVISLCVRTYNFPHMLEYYELFTEVEERTQELINYMCAGLYVSGKHFFESDQNMGKDIFEKVAISCSGMTKFLKAIVKELVDRNFYDESKAILKRFPSSDENVEDYLVSKYIANLDTMNNTEKISEGLKLYNEGHKDPFATRHLIETLREEKDDVRAQEYLDEAMHTWPEEFSAYKKSA